MTLFNLCVKETPVTSTIDDDADQVERPLNTSVSIYVIERSCTNHLATVDEDTSLCGLVWVKRNWFFHTA